MKIQKKSNYTLITSEENSFSEFYDLFLESEKGLKKEHIVLQISDNLNSTEKDFLVFLDIAKKRKENGTSFVVISTNVNVDSFPEIFTIVPTLIEAEDVIEMEAMERELGF
ncbi:MAG: hypothetical protein ACPGTO_03485 [Polaribacter sp.]